MCNSLELNQLSKNNHWSRKGHLLGHASIWPRTRLHWAKVLWNGAFFTEDWYSSFGNRWGICKFAWDLVAKCDLSICRKLCWRLQTLVSHTQVLKVPKLNDDNERAMCFHFLVPVQMSVSFLILELQIFCCRVYFCYSILERDWEAIELMYEGLCGLGSTKRKNLRVLSNFNFCDASHSSLWYHHCKMVFFLSWIRKRFMHTFLRLVYPWLEPSIRLMISIK